MAELEPLKSIPDFLLNAPLYETFKLAEGHMALLSGRADNQDRKLSNFDGYCPYCRKDTTFKFSPISIPYGTDWDNVEQRNSFDHMSAVCVRSKSHVLRFWVRIHQLTITKIGQHPSVADIAINEVRTKYRTVLKGENWSELYKAIGLAAHGEGIGSFVYLRRVIERLVRSRFDAFKAQEGWTDDEFNKRRMVEKIEYIGSHLPKYLVENRRIYGIFSVGIHELENDKCLEFFEIGKRSIIMILQDDLVKQEELAARVELEKAIQKFDPKAE